MNNEEANGASISHDPVYDVVLFGEIDSSNAGKVKATLIEAIDLCKREIVVIHAAAVTFMDSSGLGVLIAVAHHARQCSRQLVLNAPSERLRFLIGMTGLAEVLPIVDINS